MPTNVAFRSLIFAISIWLSAGPIGATQKESQGDPLEPGKTIERELAGGESHSYLITLAPGQILQANITQRQTDLTATLFGPDGRQVGQFDGWWHGPEPVCCKMTFLVPKRAFCRLQPLNLPSHCHISPSPLCWLAASAA